MIKYSASALMGLAVFCLTLSQPALTMSCGDEMEFGNVISLFGHQSPDETRALKALSHNEIETNNPAEVLSLNAARTSRQRQGPGYLSPRDSLFDDQLKYALNIAYLYGLLIVKNKLPTEESRPEHMQLFLEQYYAGSIEVIDYIKANYQPELYEEALTPFLQLYFLVQHPEFERLRERLAVPKLELTSTQRTQLMAILPDQVETREEASSAESIYNREVVKTFYDKLEIEFAHLVAHTNQRFQAGLFNNFNETRHNTVLTFAFYVSKLNRIMEIYNDPLLGGIEELSLHDLRLLHFLLARVETLRNSPSMKKAFDVPTSVWLQRQLLRLTNPEHQSPETSLQVYWYETTPKYFAMCKKEFAKLKRHIADIEALLPEEMRIDASQHY
ncbi:MAG: hypothetical protein HRT45_09735 [Bdellovibrionales bacterium]|nr:hypothetical protein [Bdellovibrionales bacterium]